MAIQFAKYSFFLALGYWLYQFTQNNFDTFGIQFRFLTHWGISLAVIVHFINWRRRLAGQPERFHAFNAAVVILNILVVFLYWRLYFIDPALVNGDKISVWHQEYYMHILGPLLLFIDAVWYNRAFRGFIPGFIKGCLATIILCLIYIIWIEALVRPLNSIPIGDVTAGLPYPFLNDMTWKDRQSFYITTTVTGIFAFILCWIIGLISDRFRMGAKPRY